MRSTETNIALKTNETMASDDGNFHGIDAAFVDYVPQATALSIELNHLVNGHAEAKSHKPTSTKRNS
jgi:hypothetical protein